MGGFPAETTELGDSVPRSQVWGLTSQKCRCFPLITEQRLGPGSRGPGRPWQGRHWKCNMLVTSLDLGISQAGFKSKRHHGLAGWPWASCLISVRFRSPIYKMGVMMIIS